MLPEMWPQCGIPTATQSASGADFDFRYPPSRRRAKRISSPKLPLGVYICQWPLIPTFARKPARKRKCESWNPTAGGRFMLQVRGVRFLTIRVDICRGRSVYNANTACRPRDGAMARLRSSSLLEARQLPISIGSSWLRRPSVLLRDGATFAPGCLTGE